VYLGSEAFVAKLQGLADKTPNALSASRLSEVPLKQRRALKRALVDYQNAHERDEAIALAFLSGHHTMAAIGEHFGVHYTTVSRLVKAYEAALGTLSGRAN
jgi:putative transposase